FIAFLKTLDGAYPAHQKIRLVLDNHSAHISKETRSYLDTVPQALRLCVHAEARLLAEFDRESIQQNDSYDAARNPGGQQARVDRPYSSILPGDQCRPGRLSVEVQNGRNLHCIDNKRTLI